MASCCASTNARTTQNNNVPSTNVELASKNAILFQNFPNPFGDGTTIRYFVPDNTSAQISFYDMYGNELKNVTLASKGPGDVGKESLLSLK